MHSTSGRGNYGSLELGEAESLLGHVDDELANNMQESTEATAKSYKFALRSGAAILLGAAAISAYASAGAPSRTAAASLVASPTVRKFTASSSDATTYYMYKYTIPIADDTRSTVATFVNEYLAPVVGLMNIGCTTYKVVADVVTSSVPLNDGTSTTGLGEFHFVDAALFNHSGHSLGEWEAALEGYGVTTFNAFMHSKLSMYVPDLAPHVAALEAGGVSYLPRLSSSLDGTDDIAHVIMQVSGHAYEVMGPYSSLLANSATASLATNFVSWSDDECPEAHRLSKTFTLAEIDGYYSVGSTTSTASTWEAASGMRTPMVVAVSVAASADSIVDTVTSALVTATGASLASETGGSGGCSVSTVQLDTSDFYQAEVRYVVNSAVSAGEGDYTLSQWESEVADSHRTFTLETEDDDGATMSGWDHYLDQHIGLMQYFYEANSDACYAENAEILALVTGLGVGARSDDGDSAAAANATHYYTGYSGLLTIEYNVYNCDAAADKTYDELCGCNADNSAQAYYASNGGASYCNFSS